MRIIGGTAAGRILKVPKGFDVRPTPDLVKQALFNSLGERIVSARVLELFGGSGALGLECLSRGAAHVTCVEKAGRHARMIQENLGAAGLDHTRFEMRVEDAFVALAQFARVTRQFDIIVADPPYGDKNIGRRSTSFAQRLLDDSYLPQVISPEGLFILGHTKRDTLSFPAIWKELKTLKHGDSVIRFLHRVNETTEEKPST
jgi:16S rRNA (guanine966-N2)-methyltransferase